MFTGFETAITEIDFGIDQHFVSGDTLHECPPHDIHGLNDWIAPVSDSVIDPKFAIVD
jgi:hypothetical protein